MEWESDQPFDVALLAVVHSPPQCVHWVDWRGNPSGASTGVTTIPQERLQKVIQGDVLGSVSELQFRDPDHFRAGEVHNHVESWEEVLGDNLGPQQLRVLRWIRNKVSVEDFFRPFRGNFKGKAYDSARPPPTQFKNNPSCRPFAKFVRKTLLDRIHSGAISLLGCVGQVRPPHLLLPLTVEPTKPRLCHDARFLNLWMADAPFKLESLSYLPRYVGWQSFQTTLDDKSGYDHLLLAEESRTYFGIQWGGWFFSTTHFLSVGRFHLLSINRQV